MIKSIKFRNYACFLNNQFIEVFNDENQKSKKINFLFGVPSSGKTSVFKLMKTVFYYMKRWLVYGDETDIVKNYSMKHMFNPNINNQHLKTTKNFIDVEIIFDNDIFSYKYELSFNQHYCQYERLYYKINGILDQWCELFNKDLIDYVEINNDIETIYETYANHEDLEMDYVPTFKGINQRNSVIPYVSSLSKSQIMKDFNSILDRVEFFDYTDFMEFKSFNFPYDEIEKNKEKILNILKKINIEFSDFKIAKENQITGYYTIDLIRKDNKKINSIQLSKGEKKLFMYVVVFTRYKSSSKNIIFIDDFSDGIDYDIFFEIIQAFEEESINCLDFQIFTANNHFFNKLKIYNSKNINIFDIVKNNDGTSNITKQSSYLNNEESNKINTNNLDEEQDSHAKYEGQKLDEQKDATTLIDDKELDLIIEEINKEDIN